MCFCIDHVYTPLSSSFYCEKTSEGINNPIEYFNLTQSYNVSHIISFYENPDSDFIEYVSEDQEGYINALLNFTEINGDIKYEIDEIYYKILSFSIFIIYILDLVVNIFILLANICKFINLKKIIIILTVLFVFNFLSLLIEILNYLLIKKLLDSLNKYYSIILSILLSEIPEENIAEYSYLNSSVKAIYITFFLSFLSLVDLVLLCKYFFNQKRVFNFNSYDDYLLIINERYYLDEIN